LDDGDLSFDAPEFGLLKSWYENGMEISGLDQGTPQAPRPHAPDSHGLHPVIMRAAVYIGVSYEVNADGSLLPVYLVYPKFVLWNPHNVPIASAKYVVQVRAYTTINTQISADLSDDGISNPRSYAAINITPGKDSFGYQGNLPNQPALNTFAHLNLGNSGANVALERDPDDNYPYFTFVIDGQDFAPGETLYFTGSDKHPNAEYIDEHIDNISSDFSNQNLLVNEEEATQGFFYLPAGAPIQPLPNTVGDPAPTTIDTDELQTTIYFRDTKFNPPDGDMEPSLTSKLYHYTESGDVVLLQKLDFKKPDFADTVIDWEHINTEGKSGLSNNDPLTQLVSYRSLNYYKDTFGAVAHRGHGYFITAMGSLGSGNRPRLLARHNLSVALTTMEDPLIVGNDTGTAYSDAIPTSNWFSGTVFPSEIPKDISYPEISADGYDRLGGFGLFENSINFSQGTVYPLYDSVRSETGLLSLGFLKNVNFSQFYWQPSFPLGNSEAHTHVHRNNIQASQGGTLYTDLSYLMNESIFDRFFLSTIPQDSSFIPTAEVVLPNSRNRIVSNADGTFPDASDMSDSTTAFEQVAANVVVEGGFNVNSTSVEAWKLFLASMRGESVTTPTPDSAASNLLVNSPLSSKVYPLLKELAAVNTTSPETWSAIRSLNDQEIDALAIGIVEEVKRRGPFLSLSDFVNRRLVGNVGDMEGDFLGLKGALQAAIDKVSISGSGLLNEAFYQSPLDGLPTGSPNGMPKNTRYPEHESGMPEGMRGSRMFGVPGFLTQGDILSALAPLMTVRGDTFTVRAFGESLGKISGNSSSRVWCEAVIQRIAEPVDSTDSIIKPTGRFGRSFKIISVRWLNENDII
jgi:hypothetical protein